MLKLSKKNYYYIAYRFTTCNPTLTHSHLNRTHSHSICTLALEYTLIRPHSHSNTLSLYHTPTLPHSYSTTLTQPHSHSTTLALDHTRTFVHAQNCTLALTIPHALTRAHTRTHTHTRAHMHTHPHPRACTSKIFSPCVNYYHLVKLSLVQ